jgi:hypothetical protein
MPGRRVSMVKDVVQAIRDAEVKNRVRRTENFT